MTPTLTMLIIDALLLIASIWFLVKNSLAQKYPIDKVIK